MTNEISAIVIPWKGKGQKTSRKVAKQQRGRTLPLQDVAKIDGKDTVKLATMYKRIVMQFHLPTLAVRHDFEDNLVARNVQWKIAQQLGDEIFIYEICGDMLSLSEIACSDRHMTIRADKHGTYENYTFAMSASVGGTGAGAGKEKKIKSRLTEFHEAAREDEHKREVKELKELIRAFRRENLALNHCALDLRLFVYRGAECVFNGHASLSELILQARALAKLEKTRIDICARAKDSMYVLWHTDRKTTTI